MVFSVCFISYLKKIIFFLPACRKCFAAPVLSFRTAHLSFGGFAALGLGSPWDRDMVGNSSSSCRDRATGPLCVY